MGLFPLKGKGAFVTPVRRTLAAMQELGTRATRAGLGSLEKLTQSGVDIVAPGVHLVPRDRVEGLLAVHGSSKIGAWFRFRGGLTGTVGTFFDDRDALAMVDLLVGKSPGTTRKIGELEESALAEMTNIALNGALNDVAEAYGLRFLTEPPVVAYGPKIDLAGLVPEPGAGDHSVVVETRFRAAGGTEGTLLLLFAVSGESEA
ncbi:MAG: hypothetical protein KY455_13460 [Euryarchaeota archaeon]|nr:hypothetical protein [Euryarchaeota archaeon]